MKNLSERPVYIVADDFTGSADSANYFGVGGRNVRVSFDREQPWDFSLGAGVVQVFDSESRTLPAVTAAKRVYQAGQKLFDHDIAHAAIYKKVDSTMRGHVGAEIESMLMSTRRHLALLAPAFPANGRVVVDGCLLVHGVPVRQTAFAKDPRNPIVQDDVAGIVQRTTNVPVIVMAQSVIRNGIGSIQSFLDDVREPYTVVVADAETDDDLAVIAAAIADDLNVLPCGSAGLARRLAPFWCRREIVTEIEDPQRQLPVCERVIVAVGSANPVAKEQLAVLLSTLETDAVVMSPIQLSDAQTQFLEMERATQEIMSIDDRIVAISLSTDRANRSDNLPGTFEGDLAIVVQRYLKVLDIMPIGLIATGGDTAFALCQALSAKAFWPQGEIATGMPWSWLETDLGTFPIVSKAGGFGSVEALYTAVAALTGAQGQLRPFGDDQS